MGAWKEPWELGKVQFLNPSSIKSAPTHSIAHPEPLVVHLCYPKCSLWKHMITLSRTVGTTATGQTNVQQTFTHKRNNSCWQGQANQAGAAVAPLYSNTSTLPSCKGMSYYDRLCTECTIH